jgi:hypothetical protein
MVKIALATLLLVLVGFWIDSSFHLRRFVFLPGGDAGLGFRSTGGRLDWIEYAPWERTGQKDYIQFSVPYWLPVGATAGLFCWVVLHKRREN